MVLRRKMRQMSCKLVNQQSCRNAHSNTMNCHQWHIYIGTIYFTFWNFFVWKSTCCDSVMTHLSILQINCLLHTISPTITQTWHINWPTDKPEQSPRPRTGRRDEMKLQPCACCHPFVNNPASCRHWPIKCSFTKLTNHRNFYTVFTWPTFEYFHFRQKWQQGSTRNWNMSILMILWDSADILSLQNAGPDCLQPSLGPGQRWSCLPWSHREFSSTCLVCYWKLSLDCDSENNNKTRELIWR